MLLKGVQIPNLKQQ